MDLRTLTSVQMPLTDERGRTFVLVNPIARAQEFASIEERAIAHELHNIKQRIHALKLRRRELDQLRDEISADLARQEDREAAQ